VENVRLIQLAENRRMKEMRLPPRRRRRKPAKHRLHSTFRALVVDRATVDAIAPTEAFKHLARLLVDVGRESLLRLTPWTCPLQLATS